MVRTLPCHRIPTINPYFLTPNNSSDGRLFGFLAIGCVFTPVLAKHLESFSLSDCISVGVDRIQRNFDPMRKQVQAWQRNEFDGCHAKLVIYEAFVERKLEAPKHLARTMNDLNFEPKYEEFRLGTIWSLSNAFPSAFKELDPIPQFKATVQNWESFLKVDSRSRSDSTAVAGGRRPFLITDSKYLQLL